MAEPAIGVADPRWLHQKFGELIFCISVHGFSTTGGGKEPYVSAFHISRKTSKQHGTSPILRPSTGSSAQRLFSIKGELAGFCR
jgi:hypothetical protein